ncbi:MAG: CPBP family intramembrane metalloprotease [Melioribacteraceae bacterium]|nr:CPBP family intramembrane metalloprotease [Melioribacteraceae bacterium]MCF8263473.1 CPBP family intramembrane metalloprotease [Melioribacteraceae bacterium]MCF8414224.1 CPBP family intramembrane metalloprotease [Melioribacteraceae bacterium]MCF8431269.1 CPBP family intramembrane metalloprotease [Melioribacteraceae bacterium]
MFNYRNNYSELLPKVQTTNLFERIILHPFTRLLIALAIVFVTLIFLGISNSWIENLISAQLYSYYFYFHIILSITAVTLIYRLYTKTVENREARELSFQNFIDEIAIGFTLAFLMISSIVFVLWAVGSYKIVQINTVENFIFTLFDQLKTGFLEELIFRVVIFKITEEWFGSKIAIIIQGLLFGLAHSGNSGASLFVIAGLVLFYSLFFASAFMVTRRIWFVMSIHWSWNLFQAGFWGINNSGNPKPSLFTAEMSGPDWLTGGEWGAEASVLAMLLMMVFGILLWTKVKQMNEVILPKWKRELSNKLEENR